MELVKKEENALLWDEKECNYIYDLIDHISTLELELETIKEGLKEWMENNNLKKVENDYFVITYIAETYRETFDSKTFRKEHEELYNDYIKLSTTKPSVRIKLK